MTQSAERASTGWHADIPASRADFNNRGPHGSGVLELEILARKTARREQRDYQLDRTEIAEFSVGKAQLRRFGRQSKTKIGQSSVKKRPKLRLQKEDACASLNRDLKMAG